MRNIIQIAIYHFCLLFFITASLTAQNKAKVLVIGMDGCRSDALLAADTPNIDALIANGVFSPDALNQDITYSGPGWSNILCGVLSDKHGVVDNTFIGANYGTYPSFFRHVEDYDPSLRTASICHWNPINNLIVQTDADFSLNVDSDLAVETEAINELSNNDTDVLFLHFDDIDGAGHSQGFSPAVPSYLEAIEATDAHIGQVMQALSQRPNYATENWLTIVTTDHGGQGTSHGGDSFNEQHIFMIASGKSIPQALIEAESSIVTNPIENCLADAEELSFDGIDDRVIIPNDPLYNFGSDQDFSIECRVRTSTAADVAIIGNKDWDSGFNKGFVISFEYPSGPAWKVNIGDQLFRIDLNSGGAIADGEWHTLSVTFDRDGQMSMYQDGVFLDDTSISIVGDIDTDAGLVFGSDINNSYHYSGAIAEVRVWNKVISPQEIQQWFCTKVDASHSSYADLIGHWKLDEGANTTQAIDHSPSANDGSIVGASWNDPQTTTIYDYTNTPRLMDVSPTLLTHLCIPILDQYGFDGESLIPDSRPLHTKLLLEGPYDISSGLMSASLVSEGLLPMQQPFAIAPWNYTGNEQISAAATDLSAVIDWVLVELWDESGMLVRKAGLLLENGSVTDTDAIENGLDLFCLAPIESTFLVIRSRNHLDVQSADRISLSSDGLHYDFTSGQVTGGNIVMKEMSNGFYAMAAGDFDSNGIHSFGDYNKYLNNPSEVLQYIRQDVNLDGFVTVADFNLYKSNYAKFTISPLTY